MEVNVDSQAAHAVLRLLVDGRSLSLAELSHALPMSRTMIGYALRRLMDQGLVREQGTHRYARYGFVADGRGAASAVVGTHSITAEVIGFDGETIASREVDRLVGREQEQIQALVEGLAAESQTELMAAVVASNERLAFPGPRLVRVERMVHLAALGEYYSVHPDDEMLYFAFVEQGRIERGIVVDGSVIRGAGGIAGLIGDRNGLTGRAGAADESLEELGKRLGDVISEDLRLINPFTVVLSSSEGDPTGVLLARVRQAVYAAADPSLTSALTIVWSGLGTEAPAIGASGLALRLARSAQSVTGLLSAASSEAGVGRLLSS